MFSAIFVEQRNFIELRKAKASYTQTSRCPLTSFCIRLFIELMLDLASFVTTFQKNLEYLVVQPPQSLVAIPKLAHTDAVEWADVVKGESRSLTARPLTEREVFFLLVLVEEAKRVYEIIFEVGKAGLAHTVLNRDTFELVPFSQRSD